MAATAKVAEKEKAQVKVVGIPIPLCFLCRQHPAREVAVVGVGARFTIRLAEGHPSPFMTGTGALPFNIARCPHHSSQDAQPPPPPSPPPASLNHMESTRFVDVEKPSITICSCIERSLALVRS
ncbi:unnamed protein product [Urochloa humidicola]